MSPILKRPRVRRLRPLVEPVAGLVFLLLWVQAEVGRAHPLGFWVVLAAAALAVGVSRLLPAVAIGLVVLVPVLQLVGLLPGPESTAWPIALAGLAVAFGAGYATGPRIRWLGLAAGAVSALATAVTLVLLGDWVSRTGFGQTVIGRGPIALQWIAVLAALGFAAYGACWLLGYALRLTARRRAERDLLARTERELAVADAELRSAEERSALGQEVHDVLAHSLAVVIAVADGTRFLREAKPEEPAARTDGALREIADTARTALVDLRALLEGAQEGPAGGELRPQPALDDLPALVDRVAATGMRVELSHLGTPRTLTPAQQLSVYRIVQESLTNVLKHAGAHPAASVSFSWEGDGLVLSVVSSGAAGVGGGAGFGIRGMKDRAHLAGGWLTAGPEAEGGFVVTAYLPVREATTETAGAGGGAGAGTGPDAAGRVA